MDILQQKNYLHPAQSKPYISLVTSSLLKKL